MRGWNPNPTKPNCKAANTSKHFHIIYTNSEDLLTEISSTRVGDTRASGLQPDLIILPSALRSTPPISWKWHPFNTKHSWKQGPCQGAGCTILESTLPQENVRRCTHQIVIKQNSPAWDRPAEELIPKGNANEGRKNYKVCFLLTKCPLTARLSTGHPAGPDSSFKYQRELKQEWKALKSSQFECSKWTETYNYEPGSWV